MSDNKGTVRHMMIRGRPQTGWAMIGRELLQDESLSGETRGIAAYVLSKPEDWVIHVMQLASHFKIGRNKVYGILKSIMLAGYGCRRRVKGEDGQFHGVEYVICDDKGAIEELKAEWRGIGTPAMDDAKPINEDDEIVAENDFSAGGDMPESEALETPCVNLRDVEKRDTVNRDEVIIRERDKNPPNPLSSAAALTAQPPQGGDEAPGPAVVRPILADFESAYIKLEKDPWRNHREREKANKKLSKLTDTEAIKALACVPNHIKKHNALYARWISNTNRRERGEQPKLARLAEYLGYKIWQTMGIPSEPLVVHAPKELSEEGLLCRRVIERNKPDQDKLWPCWLSEGSQHWKEWDELCKKNGFAGAPVRVAESYDDEWCGAMSGTRGWRFPTERPQRPPELVGWIEAPEEQRSGFLKLKKFYHDALRPFPNEEYAWSLWRALDEFNLNEALVLCPLHLQEHRLKHTEWVMKSRDEATKPRLPRPADFLFAVEQGEFQYLHDKNERALA